MNSFAQTATDATFDPFTVIAVGLALVAFYLSFRRSGR